jgi:hypothetical protein
MVSRDILGLGMICSEAKSMSPAGRSLPYPRAHWLLEDTGPIGIFLGSLRQHIYPFSGATFLLDLFYKYPVPWYSSAFPDTEMVMKMCSEYKIMFAEGLTVEYLENPASESHSLNDIHREFGTFQSLVRVFAHSSYETICKQIPDEFRDEFLRHLIDGLESRFKHQELKTLIIQVALERTCELIGVFPQIASEIAKGYGQIGDSRAVEVLRAMGAEFSGNSRIGVKLHKVQTKGAKLPARFFLLIFRSIPYRFRRPLVRALMRTGFAKSKLSNWDLNWKNK